MNDEIRKARTEARFWSKVDVRSENECWLWQGGKNQGGYGVIGVDSKNMLAHRYSWQLHYGPIPDDPSTYHGTCILHDCDVRACVNPAHLFLGTHEDNMNEMAYKGRASAIKQRKLTDEQVNEIKTLLSSRRRPSLRKIAAQFGVSHNAIWFIDQEITWRE